MKTQLSMNPFTYREVGIEHIDAICPLWEKLSAHHARLSPHFSARRMNRTFESRRQEFVTRAKDGKSRIELVYHAEDGIPSAYCVTYLSPDGTGEIDSLFVEEDLRGRGIGTELMRHALEWLDAQGATSKIVIVMHGNEDVFNFYSHFGFYPDKIMLRQKT